LKTDIKCLRYFLCYYIY